MHKLWPLIYIMLVVGLCALLVLIIFVIMVVYRSHSVEHMTSSRYADCPQGYSLNGNSCVPAVGAEVAPQCPSGGTPVDGVCVDRHAATCPSGYQNYSYACKNIDDPKKTLPLSRATCPAGATKVDWQCETRYDGVCPMNYKNSKSGELACVPEYPSLSPQCNSDETLLDGKCFPVTKSEAFVRAQQMEAEALAAN